MEYLGYPAILIMGIILGLMGGGGSILTVPILVYLFAMEPTVATGHSLFIVGITALIGAIINYKNGDVNFKVGLAFALPSIIGVNISRALIIPHLPAVILEFPKFLLTKEILIMATFAFLMIGASYSMIKKSNLKKGSSAINYYWLSIQGWFVGLIVGFVGAGGGFLIIPALILWGRLSVKVAIGTSLMIIATQSLIGFFGDILRGSIVNWQLLVISIMMAGVGILIGSTISKKIKEEKLKSAFGWFILIMGTIIIFEQFNKFSQENYNEKNPRILR